MYLDSKILDIKNAILSKIQDKMAFLTDKSYILSNIDHLLFFTICVSIVASILVSNTYVAPLLCLVAVLYILTLMLKKGTQLKLERSTLFLWLYFLLAIASTINSTMPHASLIGLSKTILYLMYFFAVVQYLRDNRTKIPIIAGLIALCVSFEVVVAYLQNSFDVMSAATWQDTTRVNPEDVLTRVYGTLKPSNPNLLGGYLIVATPFLWMFTALSYFEKKNKSFLIGIIFSIAVIPAIFMTGCRGAYLALFAMLLAATIVAYKICQHHYQKIYEKINKHKNSILMWLCGIGAGILICVPKISHRILSIFAMRNDSSTSFRMNVYNSSLQMIHDNIWLGIGCGNKVFREIYGLYMLSGFDALSAYSIFLETAVESGIFALLFYLLFLWFLLTDGIKTFLKSKTVRNKIILGAGLISILGVIVHGLFDTVYFRPQIQLIFWVAVAVISIYSDNSNEDICPDKAKEKNKKHKGKK